MTNYCKQNLKDIYDLLDNLNEIQYQQKSTFLSGSSIGEHVRHILEFYICMIKGSQNGCVNYDKRKRNIQLENNNKYAQETIQNISNELTTLESKLEVELEGNLSVNDTGKVSIPTSILREMAFCLDHSIHHQAMIKVALKEQNSENLIDEKFGVAHSTLRHRNTLATT